MQCYCLYYKLQYAMLCLANAKPNNSTFLFFLIFSYEENYLSKVYLYFAIIA